MLSCFGWRWNWRLNDPEVSQGTVIVWVTTLSFSPFTYSNIYSYYSYWYIVCILCSYDYICLVFYLLSYNIILFNYLLNLQYFSYTTCTSLEWNISFRICFLSCGNPLGYHSNRLIPHMAVSGTRSRRTSNLHPSNPWNLDVPRVTYAS